jgi:hypothetical protein
MTTTEPDKTPITFTPSNRLIDADRLALMLRELAKMQDVAREPIPDGTDPELAYTIQISNFGRVLTAATYRSLAFVLELSRVEYEPGQVITPRFVSVPTAMIPDVLR